MPAAGEKRMHCLCKVQIENGACLYACLCVCVCVCACFNSHAFSVYFYLHIFSQFYFTFLWKLKAHKRFKRQCLLLGVRALMRWMAHSQFAGLRRLALLLLFPLYIPSLGPPLLVCVCVRSNAPISTYFNSFCSFRQTHLRARTMLSSWWLHWKRTHTARTHTYTHTHTQHNKQANSRMSCLRGLLLWLPLGLTRHWLKCHKHLIARCRVVCCKCVCVCVRVCIRYFWSARFHFRVPIF